MLFKVTPYLYVVDDTNSEHIDKTPVRSPQSRVDSNWMFCWGFSLVVGPI